jgi:drug/metabolite transporter (DMT)-like permease
VTIAAGLALALASTLALNLGWVAQHEAAAGLPPLALRRPLRSLRALFSNLRWVAGFCTGLAGWGLYIAALALAPLSLVQGVSAGGLGVLALLVQRRRGERLRRGEWTAVAVALGGLVLLAASLAGGVDRGHVAGAGTVAVWLACSAAAVAVLAGPAARGLAGGAGLGLAAGTLYAAGDVATKAAVGGRWPFVAAILVAHGGAFVALQLAFQRGNALVTAGLNTLATNALPILAGIVLFHESFPSGPAGVVRGVAFAATVAGGALLARPDEEPLPAVVPAPG